VPSSDQERGRDGDEVRASPRIPSFESLRAPRRRTAVDVLTPGLAPVAEVRAPGPADVAPAPGQPAAAGPRPATYADLLHFGLRMASAVVAGPSRCLRRLLGGQPAPGRTVRR